MKKILKSSIVALLALTVLFTSCKSYVQVNSIPAGAKVYDKKGKYLGDTPLKYGDYKISGLKKNLRLEKEGYEDYNLVLTRNHGVNTQAIVTSIFLVNPLILLWVQNYEPYQICEMKSNSGYSIEQTNCISWEQKSTCRFHGVEGEYLGQADGNHYYYEGNDLIVFDDQFRFVKVLDVHYNKFGAHTGFMSQKGVFMNDEGFALLNAPSFPFNIFSMVM